MNRASRFFVRLREPVEGKEKRQEIASLISGTIEAGRYRDTFVPYMPMEHDSSFWTLDTGNDWKLKFEEDKTVFEIFHRYHDEMATEGLVKWIAYRLGGSFFEKER